MIGESLVTRMATRIPKGLRQVFSAGLSYRIALAATMLTAVFILTIGGASYYVMRTQITEGIKTSLRHDAARLAGHVGNVLGSVTTTLASLSRNSMMANALLDSAGREIYLVPFLRDFSEINGIPVEMTLTDFEGKPLSELFDGGSAQGQPHWVNRVVDEKKSHASIEHVGSEAFLLVVEPVFYARTGRAEGALVGKLSLADVFPPDVDGRQPHRVIRLAHRGHRHDGAARTPSAPAGKGPRVSGGVIAVTHPITVADILAPLDLAIEVAEDRSLLSAALTRLAYAYTAIGILLVMFVLTLSLVAGQHLVRPLRDLEQGARSVVESGSFGHRFAVEGIDEIARLGALFNQMLIRLGNAYEALEHKAAALLESEARYRGIFDTATVGIWEEDISRLRTVIAELKQRGVSDFRAYLDEHPDFVRQAAGMIEAVDVNEAALQMFGARDKQELLGSLDRVFTPESYAVFREELAAIAEGQTTFSAEAVNQTLQGEARQILFGSFIPVQAQGSGSMLVSMMDITDRKRDEQALRQTNDLLHSISRAQSQYMTHGNERAVFDGLLTSLLTITESEYGFIGEIQYSNEGKPSVNSLFLTNADLDKETQQFFEKYRSGELEFTNLETLFGAVITTEEPVIANNPATDLRRSRGGLPHGHPVINSFLGIPFMLGEKMVGMAGIANRSGGYDEALVAFLQPFLTTWASLIQALGTERQRKQAQEALRESEEKYRSTMEASLAGIYVIQDLKFQYANSTLARLFGYEADEITEKLGPEDLVTPEDHERVRESLLRRGEDELGHPYEIKGLRKDGSVFNALVWIKSISYQGKLASVGTVLDITEQKRAEKRIRYLAQHDALTDLPNRSLLLDRLSQAFAHAQRDKTEVALLFLDLDRFKMINDSLGHHVGDKLLQAVAERLRGCIRESDTVSRQGGDEFVLVLPNIKDNAVVAHITEKIVAALADPFFIDGNKLATTASIGISIYPSDGDHIETLTRNADAAMYVAKANGRNNYQFFTPDMNARAVERLAMENSLRRALERNEFVLHYQPQVALDTGQLIGIEALIRWQHPELGLVAPTDFIPLAEESGLITPLCEWVLLEACRQNYAWQLKEMPAVPVAVNISALQFRDKNFQATVTRILGDTGLDPNYLELELTEGIVMHNVEATIVVLQALKALGVQLSIDDFGTGYSSLSYLQQFPFDKLKVDQSFVRGLATNPIHGAIVKTVIALGQGLHMRVIAEGVEREDELALLRQLECDEAQGFFYSRPLPADQFVKWFYVDSDKLLLSDSFV